MGLDDSPSCPFCDYTNKDHYFLIQHVETVHPEGTSPFVVSEGASQELNDPDVRESTREGSPEYIECQCGEFCVLPEFESHLEMHYAEGIGFDENGRTSPDLAASNSTVHHGGAASPAMEISTLLPLQSCATAAKDGPVKPSTRTSTARRHSLTVVGFERRRNGACNLLVLDPMFKPSPGIYQLINVRFRTSNTDKLLKAYRRGQTYLSKYTNFEILK
ncbi:hypothetical protein P7C71_g6031, partial [Lecanoromycetidae sp. Uapishka_2]